MLKGKLMNTKARNANAKKYISNLTAMLLFFPVTIFYMEIVVRMYTVGAPTFSQLINIFMFSFSIGAAISAIVTAIRNKTVLRIVIIALALIIAIILAAQMIYFDIFKNYFSFSDAGMAGDAISQFYRQIFVAMENSAVYLVFLFLPVVLIIVFNKRITHYPVSKTPPILTYFCVSIMALSFILGAASVCSDKEIYGSMYYYKYPNDTLTANNVGLLTATRLSIQKLLFGGLEENVSGVRPGMDDIYIPFESEEDSSDTSDTSDTDTPEPPIEYGYNVIEGLDFSETSGNIGKMNTYFSSLTPTKQNKYTGMFEGYNLVYITLEGFSGKVINPHLTPTLYKMSTSGFVFNNYYNAIWSGSTSTGEYANLTGNFYEKVECMRDYMGNNYMPFSLGNQFNSLGYNVMAFHAGTYKYYNRHLSYPALGYKNYYAEGSGLENMTDSEGNKIKFQWPESDLELAKVTVNQYMDKEPFHVYYLSISGHANYNWTGNNMCKRHKAEINAYCQQYGLSYSEEVKAYLACQLEVELMLTELLEEYEEAGILDNTVFVIGADHYPYNLSDASLAELYGLPVDGVRSTFDVYRNTLIIWNSAMEETVYVDKPCSAIDILPTVSNLFGLEYDSRLMAGKDVFSDIDPIVIINFQGSTWWNWITCYGTYNVKTKTFTPTEGFSATDDEIKAYVSSINTLVSAQKVYVQNIVKYDYYAYVFGKK